MSYADRGDLAPKYLTRKVPLAAYLRTRGYDVAVEPYQTGDTLGTIYAFDDGPNLRTEVERFDVGIAQSEVLNYEAARAYVVKIAKDGLAALRRIA